MWCNVHMWLNLVLVVFTVVCFTIAMLTFKDTGGKNFATPKLHHLISLVVCVLASVQVIGILPHPHINHSKNAVATNIQVCDYYHRITSVLLLGIGCGKVQRVELLVDVWGVTWCHGSCHGGQEDYFQDTRTQRDRKSGGHQRSSSGS